MGKRQGSKNGNNQKPDEGQWAKHRGSIGVNLAHTLILWAGRFQRFSPLQKAKYFVWLSGFNQARSAPT
jgi:hypothetical protein